MENKSTDITSQLEPFLTDIAKEFLNNKFDSPVITYKVGNRMEICLCQFIGTTSPKKIAELNDMDFERFAHFLNKAIEHKILQHGVYGVPMAMELEDRTILKIYAFSNFNIFEMPTILRYGLGFDDVISYPEGGLPIKETADRYIKEDNIYKKIFNAGVQSLKL